MTAKRTSWAFLTLLATVGLTLATTPVAAQDEILAAANQAYQEGAYEEAIEAYSAVQSGGYNSAGLEYNLGNAWFKSGNLARAILHWERALALAPGDDDTLANLELARSITVDAVEPLPTFWLFDLVSRWVRFPPMSLLFVLVGGGWLATTGGVALFMLAPNDTLVAAGRWTARAGLVTLVVFGTHLLVREAGWGQPERAIVMVDVVPVRSAPADDDDLTLFEVHEGTRVRIEERTGQWVEVVLDDGKVGWIPIDVMEVI
jgi:hypothetical protein